MTNEPQKISPDDPKLTAYALDELPVNERAQVEAQLQNDPEACAAVAEIRAFAVQMQGALASEPVAVDPGAQPLLGAEPMDPETPPQGVAIIRGRDLKKLDGGPAWHGSPRRAKLLEFPQLYYVIGGLAAAGFAIVVAVREPAPPREVKVYREILLNPPTPAVAVAEPKAEDESAAPVGEPTIGGAAAAESTAQAVEAGTERGASAPGLASLDQSKIAVPPVKPSESSDAVNVRQPEWRISVPTLLAEAKAASDRLTRLRIESIVVAKNSGVVSTGGTPPAQLVRLNRAKPEAAWAYRSGGGFVKDGTYYYPSDPKFVFPTKPMPNHDDVIRAEPDSGALAFDVFPAFPRSTGPLPLSIPSWPVNPFKPLPRSLIDAALERGAAVRPIQRDDLFPGPTRRSSDAAKAASFPFERDNPFVNAVENPISTFAVNVDGASYANVRRFIENGQLPPPAAVRIEELLNYFPYAYANPAASDAGRPFHLAIEVAPAPWEPKHDLVRIGVRSLATVVHHVRLAVQFTPGRVSSYRLIGYENRAQPGGLVEPANGSDLRAGVTVTALYEVVPAVVTGNVTRVTVGESRTIATVKISYAEPAAISVREANYPVTESEAKFADASADFKFAAAVAEYGMILRHSPHRGKATMGDVIAWAAAGSAKPGEDPAGYRRDFIDLARRTEALLQ